MRTMKLTEVRPALRRYSGWAAWSAFLVAWDAPDPESFFPVWVQIVASIVWLGVAAYFAIQWLDFRRHPLRIDAVEARPSSPQDVAE